MKHVTKPYLGENNFGENRKPLPVPWKPIVFHTPNSRGDCTNPDSPVEESKVAETTTGPPEEEDEEFNLLEDLLGFGAPDTDPSANQDPVATTEPTAATKK